VVEYNLLHIISHIYTSATVNEQSGLQSDKQELLT